MDSFVSREEFEELKDELGRMRAELREILRSLVNSVELTDEHPWSRAKAESMTGGEQATYVFIVIGACLDKAETGKLSGFSDEAMRRLPVLREVAVTPIETRADIVGMVSKVVGNTRGAAILVDGYEKRGLGREGFAVLKDSLPKTE